MPARRELATVVERARRLEGALDLVGEGIVVADVDGRRLFTNAAAGLLTDARHEEALVAAAVDEALAEGLEGRTVEQGDRAVRPAHPPGRRWPRRRSGPAAARLGAVVLVRDESRLRRLEAIRQEFVANVSHELKTPIGAIALLAETLAATDDPVDAERRIDLLVEEAHRLGRIIDDLLELSEVEGRDRSREPVDLADLVEESVRGLQPAGRAARAWPSSWTLAAGPGLPGRRPASWAPRSPTWSTTPSSTPTAGSPVTVSRPPG